MAATLLASAVISSETLPLKKLFPTNTLSASAATTYGKWKYEEITKYTARLVSYTGSETNIIIPEAINNHTVTELGEGLFDSNSTVKSVSIPRGVRAIPSNAFRFCTSLTTVNIPSGVTSIGDEAFRYCTSLVNIYLPSSLKTLGDGAFYICSNLKTVSMPSCEYIYGYAFAGCRQLKSLTLPSNLKYLGEFVFDNDLITSVKFTNTNSSSFSAKKNALKCSTLTNIDVPNANIFGVLLRDRALADCRNLTNVNGSSLVKYTSSRFGPYTKPYIPSDYLSQITKYLASVDEDRIGFFEKYLSADISFIVMDTTCNCKTDGEKIKALHDWVCNKVNYDYLPNGKENHALYNHVDSSAFLRDKTICDGYARAMKLLLDEAGIEAYFTSSDTHAWTIVKLGDYYFHLDACHDDGNGTIYYDHYLKSDSDISRCTSHKNWITSRAASVNYPPSRISTEYIYGVPSCPYSMGDANLDGYVNQKDADLLKSIINGKPISKYYDGTLGDADFDGRLTMNDVYAINDIIKEEANINAS